MSKLYLFLLFFVLPLDATTLVYNIRTRHLFELGAKIVAEQEQEEKKDTSSLIATAIPIVFTSTRQIKNDNLVVNVCDNPAVPDKPLLLGGGIDVGWNETYDTRIFFCWLQVTKIF